MKKINKKIDSSLLLIIYFYLQPFLDVIYAISNKFLHFSVSINSIVRIAFLAFAIIYLLFINKDKKSKVCTFLIGVYLFLFTLSILIFKDTSILFYEVRNAITTFYFPIIMLFMYTLNKENKINIAKKHYFYVNLIYLFFIIVPNIMGLGLNTYYASKGGTIGWFYTANSVGSILLILLPYSLSYIKESKKYLLGVFYYALMLYVAFTVGTKTPLIGMALITTIVVIKNIVDSFKKKNYKFGLSIILTCAIGIVLSLVILPHTLFYSNLKAHMGYQDLSRISSITDKKFVNHIIFSRRLMFLENTNRNYVKSNVIEKIVGIGYVENYKQSNQSIKLVEMDYFDIFYRHGILGFILYFYIIISLITSSFKESNTFNKRMVIMFVILLSFFCGHVLISSSVSIFISYILNSKEHKYEKSKS